MFYSLIIEGGSEMKSFKKRMTEKKKVTTKRKRIDNYQVDSRSCHECGEGIFDQNGECDNCGFWDEIYKEE